jgi:hypothetical protein
MAAMNPNAPLLDKQRCAKCGLPTGVKPATVTERFVYMRCANCSEIWAIPERRKEPRKPEN